jgi:hypothetical protein
MVTLMSVTGCSGLSSASRCTRAIADTTEMLAWSH